MPRTPPPQPPSKIASGESQRVTVVLSRDQIRRLDALRGEVAVALEKRRGQVVSTSEIVRALLNGLLDSGIEPKKLVGEEEMRDLFTKKLQRK